MAETAALALRDYQTAAIEAVERDLAGDYQRVAVVKPTGTGKTVTFSHMAARVIERGGNALVLVHRDELANQTVNKLREIMPGLDPGVVKAERDEIDRRAIVASIQTLASPVRRRRLADALGVSNGATLRVIVDECHHAVAPTYRAALDDLGCMREVVGIGRSGSTAVGFTATMGRTDGVALGKIWQRVSYEMDILDAIRAGHLVDVRGRRVFVSGLDLGQVRRTAGDYSEADLGDALTAADAPDQIAKAVREHAAERQGLIFTPTVETAHLVTEAMQAQGFTCATIWGAMPLELRRATLAAFHAGAIQWLSNCMVLTEGFDAPEASCVVVARPTSSAPLYTQIVGRVLRPFPGKRDALVLDVVGVGTKHRLASLADLAGVDVPEDKTIIEAVAEDEQAAGEDEVHGRRQRAARRLVGELASREFDLFGESRRQWLVTRGGVRFIDAGDELVFLAPGAEMGTYNVAACPADGEGGRWIREGLDMSYAMAWAEQAAAYVRKGGQVVAGTKRDAAWRRAEPTSGQLAAARAWGIQVPEGATRGQVSDLISTRRASKRIDRLNMFVKPETLANAYEVERRRAELVGAGRRERP